MRFVPVALLLALGLATAPASAQRRPTERDRRTVQGAAITTRVAWEEHQPFFDRVDRLLGGLHGKAIKRGNRPDKLNSMSPIQLTGSAVYGVAASLRKNMLPKFDDIDLRMVGVTPDEVRAAIVAEFPEAADRITVEPAYLPGLVHMQAEIGDRQLDISIYPNKRTYLAPHQRLSIAALKLNVNPENRLLPTLRGLLNSTQAREHRTRRLISDPAGTGLEDAEDGFVRTYVQPGMDPRRAPEGLLHAAYWTGKVDDGVQLEERTEAEFRRMPEKQFRQFFGTKDAEVARARRNYVFSVLRVKPGRNPAEVLVFLRDTGALPKILPGMEAVVDAPEAWRTTTLVATRAYTAALKASNKTDPRWAREVMLAAVLSGMPSRVGAARALDQFTWLEGDAAKDDEFSRQRVLKLQGKLFGVSSRYLARLDALPEPDTVNGSALVRRLELDARVELERGVARIVSDHGRKMTGGPAPTGAWARSTRTVGEEGPRGSSSTGGGAR